MKSLLVYLGQMVRKIKVKEIFSGNTLTIWGLGRLGFQFRMLIIRLVLKLHAILPKNLTVLQNTAGIKEENKASVE